MEIRGVNNKKGFTLLEILLVIAAIGILAAIVLIAINPNRQLAQARDVARQSDINTLQKALDQYLIETRAYPPTVSTIPGYICNTGNLQTGGPTCSGLIDLKVLVPNYIAAIPRDTQATGDNMGYMVSINPNNNKISIVASLAERKFIALNPSLIINGLVLNLDAGDTASYPGNGTNWFDLSKNNNRGTLINGVGYDSSDGGSLVFDGINDYVVGNNNLGSNINNAFTISIWLKNTNLSGGVQRFFTLGLERAVIRRDGGTNTLHSYINTGSGVTVDLKMLFINNALSSNTIYNFTTVWNGSSLIVYKNGVQIGISTPGGSVNEASPSFFISSSVEPLNGNIYSILLYNNALNSSEVQQNFNATRSRFGL